MLLGYDDCPNTCDAAYKLIAAIFSDNQMTETIYASCLSLIQEINGTTAQGRMIEAATWTADDRYHLPNNPFPEASDIKNVLTTPDRWEIKSTFTFVVEAATADDAKMLGLKRADDALTSIYDAQVCALEASLHEVKK